MIHSVSTGRPNCREMLYLNHHPHGKQTGQKTTVSKQVFAWFGKSPLIEKY
jgi:hypothetical protein